MNTVVRFFRPTEATATIFGGGDEEFFICCQNLISVKREQVENYFFHFAKIELKTRCQELVYFAQKNQQKIIKLDFRDLIISWQLTKKFLHLLL